MYVPHCEGCLLSARLLVFGFGFSFFFRSERASATNNRGEQLRQGANINKSLLSLANCINALAGNRRRRGGKVRRMLWERSRGVFLFCFFVSFCFSSALSLYDIARLKHGMACWWWHRVFARGRKEFFIGFERRHERVVSMVSYHACVISVLCFVRHFFVFLWKFRPCARGPMIGHTNRVVLIVC